MSYTHIIIGGGSAGCVLASRLSANPDNSVLLIEAGPDFQPGQEPDDIRSTFAGHAFANPDYFWPDLKAVRSRHADRSPAARTAMRFEQGRLMGGGSSINSQTALWSAPEDYDAWEKAGAKGWTWQSVSPYFQRAETDRDYSDGHHGQSGPIIVRRTPVEQWDAFSVAVNKAWSGFGYNFINDLNDCFVDGFGAIPSNNDGKRRVSAASAYLSQEVRARSNLTIMANCLVRRIEVDGRRASGVEIETPLGSQSIAADTVILSAGAIHSPAVLQRSGIGAADRLRDLSIAVERDLPGVGQHLLDHPMISISAFLPPKSRQQQLDRRSYSYLRYSSGHEGCGASDMVMMAASRSAWHAIGVRLATMSAYVGQSFSQGDVAIISADPHKEPEVCFNLVDDERDLARLVDSFRFMAKVLTAQELDGYVEHPFPSVLSDRVKKIGTPTPLNRLLTDVAGTMLDMAGPLRGTMIDMLIAEGPTLRQLLADPDALRAYVADYVVTCYHASGTCRMGAQDDPNSVVGPDGRIIGMDNLYVADSSIFPDIPRNNINLPVIMVAERIADIILNEAPNA